MEGPKTRAKRRRKTVRSSQSPDGTAEQQTIEEPTVAGLSQSEKAPELNLGRITRNEDPNLSVILGGYGEVILEGQIHGAHGVSGNVKSLEETLVKKIVNETVSNSNR